MIALSWGIKISTVHCLVLSQSTRVTDGRTDRQTQNYFIILLILTSTPLHATKLTTPLSEARQLLIKFKDLLHIISKVAQLWQRDGQNYDSKA